MYAILKFLMLMVVWFDLIILTTILYIMTFLPERMTRNSFPPLFRTWCRWFLRAIGVELSVHQKHAKPLPDHYVLIANHPSILEDIGVPSLFDVVCLAKAEVGKWWIFGRIAQRAGTIFVQREASESRASAKQEIIDTVKSGRNVALYPEGGCHGRRISDRFFYGAFEASLQTGVPIIPVFLQYEAQESFEWGNETGPQKVRTIFKAPNRKANYYVHDPFYPERFPDRQAYMDHARRMYLKWQRKYLE